jgi:hydroxyacylglutathione hydrolase
MTTTRLVPVPAFNDNYLWVLHKNGRAVVVDPGDAAPIEAFLEEHQLTLDAILLTHHHGDHVGGVQQLRRRTNAPVYGPATEKLPHCDYRLKEGNRVELPGIDMVAHVLDVPGHTAGHIAYFGHLETGEPLVFCGDTLFAGGCGRLFEGTAAQMVDSLGKLTRLPPETLVCCAHEYTLANLRWALHVEPDNPLLQQRFQQVQELRRSEIPTLPSTIALERDTNPFCRLSEPAVMRAASGYVGSTLQLPADVFAGLREWKNNF